jgi:hypothetical protein
MLGIGDLFAKLGKYARLQLLGVLVPGIVILLEFWIPLASWISELPPPTAVKALSTGELVIFVVLVLYVVYILGYVGREISWKTADAAARRLHLVRPRSTPSELAGEIGDIYGDENVARALASHDALLKSLDHDDAFARNALEYAKTWLSTRHPELAVDSLEGEINLLVGTIVPILLAPLLVLEPFDLSPFRWRWGLGTLCAFALAILIVRFVVIPQRERLARGERRACLQHLCLARWFEEADGYSSGTSQRTPIGGSVSSAENG